jgi:hypothetical protein
MLRWVKMLRQKLSKHSLVILLVNLFSLGTLLSCGKQSNTAQSDDISSTSTISYSGGWGGEKIPIKVSSQIIFENQENQSYQDVKAQLQRAFDIWNKAIGQEILILNLDPNSYLSETGNTLPSCSGIPSKLYYPLCDKTRNGLFYDRVSNSDANLPKDSWKSGWDYNTGKDPSILATTVWNAAGNIMTSANIRFNRDNYFFGDSTLDMNVYEDGTQKTLVDFESVALHELGHVLGLGHDNVGEDSIMYPTMNIGPDKSNPNYNSSVSTIKRTLSECDINRVQHIYSGGSLNSKCRY